MILKCDNSRDAVKIDMKLQYAVLNKRYNEFKVEYKQIYRENKKLTKIIKDQEKIINNFKREILGLNCLLNAKLEKLKEKK